MVITTSHDRVSSRYSLNKFTIQIKFISDAVNTVFDLVAGSEQISQVSNVAGQNE